MDDNPNKILINIIHIRWQVYFVRILVSDIIGTKSVEQYKTKNIKYKKICDTFKSEICESIVSQTLMGIMEHYLIRNTRSSYHNCILILYIYTQHSITLLSSHANLTNIYFRESAVFIIRIRNNGIVLFIVNYLSVFTN